MSSTITAEPEHLKKRLFLLNMHFFRDLGSKPRSVLESMEEELMVLLNNLGIGAMGKWWYKYRSWCSHWRKTLPYRKFASELLTFNATALDTCTSRYKENRMSKTYHLTAPI